MGAGYAVDLRVAAILCDTCSFVQDSFDPLDKAATACHVPAH